jgi:peroxiredoxin
MESGILLTKRNVTILLTAVIVVAIFGALAGNGLLAWQQQRANAAKLAGLEAGESSRLRAGDPIPEIELLTLDGNATTTTELSADQDLLLFFVAINCEPCTEAVTSWFPLADHVPSHIAIYAVCQEYAEYARVYVDKTGMIFPTFCDTARTFDNKYDLNIYPTVVGIRAGGTIAFIKHGFDTEFDPMTAAQMLMASTPRRSQT